MRRALSAHETALLKCVRPRGHREATARQRRSRRFLATGDARNRAVGMRSRRPHGKHKALRAFKVWVRGGKKTIGAPSLTVGAVTEVEPVRSVRTDSGPVSW